MDGDYIDVSSLPDGKLILIVTVKDSEGKAVAVKTKVLTKSTSGIKEISVDGNAPVDIYSIDGILLHKNADASALGRLPHSIYIIRQGSAARKVLQ